MSNETEDNQLKSRSEMIGKTIESIKEYDDYHCYHFTDNTYIIIDHSLNFDNIEIIVIGYNDINDYAKFQLGLITESEYSELKLEKEKIKLRNQEKREMELLQELKRKYENE